MGGDPRTPRSGLHPVSPACRRKLHVLSDAARKDLHLPKIRDHLTSLYLEHGWVDQDGSFSGAQEIVLVRIAV